MGFTLTIRLGRGQTVDTFAAVLEHGGERLDVAIKRPRPELLGNQPFREAFRAWGQAQLELESDALVACLEAGETPEGPYVIQERVEGPALARVLQQLRKSRRAFRPELALRIASSVSEALAALHAAGRVHGGLDTGEVLVSYRGQVKAGDQGLHRLDWLAGDGVAQPPIYLPPELKSGGEPAASADVYAFGLVTLEMLIGQPVWTAETMTVEASIRALRDFSHLAQAQPGLTEDLVALLLRCTATAPGERFSSGVQVHQALSALISQHQLTADDAALGNFVRALVPRPKQEEAPTMLVHGDRAHRASSDTALPELQGLKALTVMVDPDLEAKALRAGRKPSLPRPVAPAPASPPLLERVSEALQSRPEIGWKMMAAGGAIVLVLLILVARRVLGAD